jgi:alcohol dehydrogenase class IV
MAKLIRCYIDSNTDLKEFIKSNQIFPAKKIPLIAIPTTAGSGSESTHFAVVYINGCKYSVSHVSIRPNYVLLVSSLTYKCPPYLTACSGSDALCQAIESYWSVQSTEESRSYAKEAILLLWKYLPQAVENDLDARRNVMLAANLAGRAINISFTTAPHACSYGLTAYAGIPHGHAVSLTLPYFFDLNMNVSADNCIDLRGAVFVRERMNELLFFLNCKTENVKEKLSSFFELLFGNKNEEAIAGITDDLRIQLALSVNLQRLQNNPVKISKEDIENIKFI